MKILKKLLKKILYCISPKKYIIFESVPDFSDNSRAVFDEMIKRGLNKKYIFIWLVKDSSNIKYNNINVRFIEKSDKLRKWYMTTAKCYICCNGFVYSDNKKQKSYFLTHGMYVKCPTTYYTLPKEIQYCLSSSEDLKGMQAKALDVDVNKMIPLGFPRNDVLTSTPIDLHKFFNQSFNSIIVWYPTFRQHYSGMDTGSKYAVPIIWNENDAHELNCYAKENEVLVVLKPHFSQDITRIKNMNLSNIILIDDSFFTENNISSYQFLNSCDAMITDYSSVYFDYTLCDKPIGLIWEDYVDYSKEPGFALDMDYYMKGGQKIYNLEDYKSFVYDVASGIDRLVFERRKIRDLANYSLDGKNSDRVATFIINESKLKNMRL